jgi:hypothetical protein
MPISFLLKNNKTLVYTCRLFYKQMDGMRKGWIQSSEESFYKNFRPDSAFWFINFFPDLGMHKSSFGV